VKQTEQDKVSRDLEKVGQSPLDIQIWPADRPKPYAKNARTVSARAIDAVATSLKEFGWRQPIVVDGKDVIIAGHKRLLAAQKLGMTQVPVHVALGLTAAQCKAYRLMDNRSNQNSDWDTDLLREEMTELVGQLDLQLTGFEAAQLAEILNPPVAVGEDEPPPAPPNPVSLPGDLWILGKHRVFCGSAADPQAFAPLSEKSEVRLLWTDPPYGVEYEGKTKDALTIKGDDSKGLRDLLSAALANAAQVMAPGSPFYIAHASGPAGQDTWIAIPTAWRVHQDLAWVKDSMVLGHSDYHYRHEGILYGYAAGGGRPGRGNHLGTRWFGGNSQTSVFQFARPKRSTEHPTMKPTDLIAKCLSNSSERGDLVLDPFSGSGSTLMACEITDRVFFGIEIDPRYMDVIVTRWQGFSGRLATLSGDGRTFEEIRLARQAPVKAKKKGTA
jgi:DNA modification methylase